jgi:glycosyltransferase involved in cell wall biosynthesis
MTQDLCKCPLRWIAHQRRASRSSKNAGIAELCRGFLSKAQSTSGVQDAKEDFCRGPIRILFLTTSPQLAGAEKQLYLLASRLDRARYEIHVVTLKGEQEGRLLEALRNNGIKTTSLNISHKWELWKLIQLWKLLKTFQPDILQSFLFFDNIVARIIGRMAHVPLIISGQRNANTSTGLRFILDRLTLPLAHHIVSNSEAGMRLLRNQHSFESHKMCVIHNGINTAIPKHPDVEKLRSHAQQKLHIGFVGYLTKQKGVDVLLKALVKLKQSHADVYCSIIGDGPELESLTKEVVVQQLQDTVGFLGKQEQAVGLMPAFDVLVLPSLWEGLPNVIMEAMAQGIPVIATNVGGVPELIQTEVTGLLIEPQNVDALVQAIVTMCDPSVREPMGMSAKSSIAQQFTLETMVEQYDQLYISLLKSS